MIILQQFQKVANAIDSLEFEHFGAGVVKVDDLEVMVEALAHWTADDGGMATFADPTFTLSAAMSMLPANTIVPEERRVTISGFRRDDESEWKMVGGMWTSKHNGFSRKHGARDEYEVRFGELIWTREGEPCWEVLVVQGFNDAIFGRSIDREVRAFDFRAFDRDAALIVLDRTDAFGAPYAALVFAGGSELTNDQVASALSLLSLVGGRMVRPASRAQHTFDGSAVSRALFRHASYPRRAVAPFRLVYPLDGVRHLHHEFGPMLDALLTAQQEPCVEIDVAITHLLADSAFLDTEIRDMTIALDTLIESKAFQPINAEPYLPTDELRALATPLLDALKPAISPEAHRRATSIVEGLNVPTHGLRRNMFWRRIGFAPTARELAALMHRHPMSHAGFLRWAKSERDEDLQRLHNDLAVLRTLVNRCIFALLGWRHPLQNHATFFDEPMPCASGAESTRDA